MPLEYSFTGRSINVADLGEFLDFRKHPLHLAPRHAQNFAVQKNVLATRKFRIESRAQFEQRRDPALR